MFKRLSYINYIALAIDPFVGPCHDPFLSPPADGLSLITLLQRECDERGQNNWYIIPYSIYIHMHPHALICIRHESVCTRMHPHAYFASICFIFIKAYPTHTFSPNMFFSHTFGGSCADRATPGIHWRAKTRIGKTRRGKIGGGQKRQEAYGGVRGYLGPG